MTPKGQFGVSVYRDKKRPYSKFDLQKARKLQPDIARGFRLVQKKSEALDSLFFIKNITAREAEIASLLVMGNDYAHIAAALQMSRNTLKWHMKNIFEKFDGVVYAAARNTVE